MNGKGSKQMISKKTFSINRYEELARQTGAEAITIGYSEKGKPIKVLKKGTGKLKVLFIARIHGNEPATSEALLDFIKVNSFNNIEFYGIYLANPDGASLYESLWLQNPEPHWGNNFNDARLNANGIDINRDWLDLSQKETQVIQKFILSIKPDFAADFHEYYWSDKGYPPKQPTDDENGFMATMTDAPFFGTDTNVREASEQSMNYLISKLENEFNWKIKTRHFVGQYKNTYESPGFLGIYLALRGIPKLLVETWGVACSTLLLDERIKFHKEAMRYLIEWIELNLQKKIGLEQLKLVATSFDCSDLQRRNSFTNMLEKHGLSFRIKGNRVIVQSASKEKGFINAIYYLIYEKGKPKNATI
jgi:hypothetical protein